jgi:hypothetical protein
MLAVMTSSANPTHALTYATGGTPLAASVRSGGHCHQKLCAQLDYDAEGALLFRLSGQKGARFAQVVGAFRRIIPAEDQEWLPELDAWVLYGGLDDELLEILADHLEPEEVLVDGHPLRDDEAD